MLRFLFHKYLYPRLEDFYSISQVISTSVEFICNGAHDSDFRNILHSLEMKLQRSQNLTFSKVTGILEEEALLLYSLIRSKKPKVIVETGVANGVSSFIILSAIDSNQTGNLVSFDIQENVGNLIPENLKKNWKLEVIMPDKKSLIDAAKEIGNIDLFIHDSDHSYSWQLFEYKLFWEKLTQNGILVSDDIDDSFAFYDFCQFINRRPKILVTTRKLLGFVEKTDGSQ